MNEEICKSQKYPRQIWAAIRKQESLVCDQNLFCPGKNADTPYLEIHTGFSVFNLNYVSKNCRILSNIPVSDVPLLLENYSFQRKVLFQEKVKRSNLPRSNAYTVQLRGVKEVAARTPAEILSIPGGYKLLQEARGSLAQNAARYPKNQIMVQAIDEALQLYQQGKILKVSAISLPSLYKKDFKYKTSRNDKGYHLVYHIQIDCVPGDDMPWKITLTNYYAPLVMTGLKHPDIKKKEHEARKTITITEEEMALLIFRIRRTVEEFEHMMFPYMWENTCRILQSPERSGR